VLWESCLVLGVSLVRERLQAGAHTQYMRGSASGL